MTLTEYAACSSIYAHIWPCTSEAYIYIYLYIYRCRSLKYLHHPRVLIDYWRPNYSTFTPVLASPEKNIYRNVYKLHCGVQENHQGITQGLGNCCVHGHHHHHHRRSHRITHVWRLWEGQGMERLSRSSQSH